MAEIALVETMLPGQAQRLLRHVSEEGTLALQHVGLGCSNQLEETAEMAA